MTPVSVFVPALNEENSLRDAVASVLSAAQQAGNAEIEILIVDDGSTDKTAAVAEELAKRHAFVRLIRHEKNRGFGASFLSALAAAKYGKITLFPGDNLLAVPTLRNMLKNAGKADLVCSYTVNVEVRSRLRNILSAVFSFIYTTTFNLPFRYMQATPVYPVALLRELDIRGKRYSFLSEATSKMLRRGVTFMELPGYTNTGPGKSSALRLKNLLEAVATYLRLVWEIHVSRRDVYSRAPVRVLPDDAK